MMRNHLMIKNLPRLGQVIDAKLRFILIAQTRLATTRMLHSIRTKLTNTFCAGGHL